MSNLFDLISYIVVFCRSHSYTFNFFDTSFSLSIWQILTAPLVLGLGVFVVKLLYSTFTD